MSNTYNAAARGWSRELQRDLDQAMARVAELKLIREKAIGELVELMQKLDVEKLNKMPGIVRPTWESVPPPQAVNATYRFAAEALIDHADSVRDLLAPFVVDID